MLQSRADPEQNRFLEKTGCCREEQFLDRIDSWKRQNAAEQSSSMDRIDSWKRRDAVEQSSSWIEQIHGKDGMLQSRAVPGQNRFLEKTGCCRTEQFLDRNLFLEKTGFYRAEQVVQQSNMWKEENNSFTFNKFFSTKMDAKLFVLFVKK